MAAAGAAAIAWTVASTAEWLLKCDPFDALKLAAAAIGLLSATPNLGALQAVWTSIISCKKNFDFTGLQIGPSTAFEAPMRSILYSYSLFLFYQIVSQILGVAGDGTWGVFLTDLGLQTAMLALVASQVGWMYARAISAFREKQKQLRFFAEFDEALRAEEISLSNLLGSTFVLAFVALLPKLVELLAPR